MNRSEYSILIIEDEVLVAADLRQTLERLGFTVVGLADKMEKAIALFTGFRPNLVICDVKIKGTTTGIDVISRLRSTYADFDVIYLTAYADEKTLADALATQPDSYLVKPFTDAQLLAAVSKAMHSLIGRQPDVKTCPFTTRELDVLALLRKGLTSNDISGLLSISIQTVKSHRKNMIRRSKVMNVTELIALSITNNWIK